MAKRNNLYQYSKGVLDWDNAIRLNHRTGQIEGPEPLPEHEVTEASARYTHAITGLVAGFSTHPSCPALETAEGIVAEGYAFLRWTDEHYRTELTRVRKEWQKHRDATRNSDPEPALAPQMVTTVHGRNGLLLVVEVDKDGKVQFGDFRETMWTVDQPVAVTLPATQYEEANRLLRDNEARWAFPGNLKTMVIWCEDREVLHWVWQAIVRAGQPAIRTVVATDIMLRNGWTMAVRS